MLNVRLFPSNGGEYLISGAVPSSKVLLIEGELEGLIGQLQRASSPRPGRSGSLAGRGRYGEIQAEMEFYLHADDGEELAAVYANFRRGWKKDTPSIIRMVTDHPLSPLEIDLYLDTHIPGVPVDLSTRTTTQVTVPVVATTGLFRTTIMRETGAKTVTIQNVGDEIIYPTLTYTGENKQVTAPSGAKFTLPTVTEKTRVSLDPFDLKIDGVFPEGINPGAKADWVIPDGVSIEWCSLIADPYA